VVTYNGMQWIEKCLASLIAGSYSCKIICIDNRSSDQTVSFIKNHFPSVQLFEAKNNLGFGQANNIGLKLALSHHADYIFLLNQDAWIEKDTISELIKVQEQNPDYGIISPVHLNGAGNNLDAYFLKYLRESDFRPACISDDFQIKRSDLLISTEFVNAAAWLINMQCLKKTGGFDPVFFHYGEDRNYLQRAKYRGFKAGIYCSTCIYHDREQRISQPDIDIGSRIKSEWIHFLGHACDINQQGYWWFCIKRFLRHSILLLKSIFLFRRTESIYNYTLAKKIFFSLNKIKQSRRIAASDDIAPYL
jgi:GT2 family glycosyltransferase